MSREMIAARAAEAVAWAAGHPALVVAGAACLLAFLTLVLAAVAWRAARRSATRSAMAADSVERIESAIADVRHGITQCEARLSASLDERAAADTDLRARLDRVETAVGELTETVKQLRADVIEQQTAKYRINEAIRQAMDR